MEHVIIITRDINGKRHPHHLLWDDVCAYVNRGEVTEEDEILMILVEGYTVYCSLGSHPITWEDVLGFFG